MGIDIVVTSLTNEFTLHPGGDLARDASLLHHVLYEGAWPPPGTPQLMAAAGWTESPVVRERPNVRGAVALLQAALSSRFDRDVKWRDTLWEDPEGEYFGQIEVGAALELRELVGRAGPVQFGNVATMDISSLYVPVPLPGVLVGAPWSIGSVVSLLTELQVLRAMVADDEYVVNHIDALEEAATRATAREAVLCITG